MSLLKATLDGTFQPLSKSLAQAWSVVDVAIALCLAAILVVLSVNAMSQGPWLDEFWTLELSDPRKGLPLLSDGWLRDTHPPGFNLWATLLSSFGITSIPGARLASNLPAAGLMIWASAEAVRRRPADYRFHVALLLVVLALPQSVEAFANYRSYFWQIAATAMLVMIARHVVMTDTDVDPRRDRGLIVVAILATVGSMALHYVSAIFGGLLVGAVVLWAARRRHWRWAGLLFATALITTLCVVAVGLLQARHWAVDLDHRWIDGQPLTAVLAVPLALISGAVVNNLIPLAALWPRWRPWSASECGFVALLAVVLALGLAVVLAVDAVQPIMVDRYLFAVPVLVAGMLAALAARFEQSQGLRLLLALIAVGVVAEPLLMRGAKPLWDEGARTIAKIVKACPTTRGLCR